MAELLFPKSPTHLQIISARIVNLIALITKEDNFLRNRYAENFAYGHQEILLKYCGLELSSQIIGVVQHGGNLPISSENISTPRFINGYQSKYWAWSKTTQEDAESQGFKHVRAIGSPWLYLRKATNSENNLNINIEEKVLIMPVHSTGNAVDVTSFKIKRERARLFREVIGSREGTVCLHPADFCDPLTRKAFTEFQFHLECIGSSNFNPAWSSVANRVASLKTLLGLMQRHTHYVSDGYGTSLIYAIDLDMNIGIFPEIQFTQKLNANNTGKNELYEKHKHIKDQVIPENMPRLLNNFARGSIYSNLARTVLGAESVLSSDDLRNILEYRTNVYRLSGDFQPW